jgi:hypothetical protein
MLPAQFSNSDLFSQTGKFEDRLLGPTIFSFIFNGLSGII